MGFRRADWPIPLVTAEDYERACTEFVMPFLQERGEKCKKNIEKLQKLLENDDNLPQAEIEAATDKVQKAGTFPEHINEFLEEVSTLERKLEGEGAFNEKS